MDILFDEIFSVTPREMKAVKTTKLIQHVDNISHGAKFLGVVSAEK
jgi:hypothetical protein